MTHHRTLFLVLIIAAVAVMPLAFPSAGGAQDATPAIPANFTATPGDGEVVLSWDDPGDASITGYQYRQQEGDGDFGDWTDISGSGATTTSHTVSGLTNGTDYAFQVRAVNASGEGTESNAASATPTVCANGTAVPNPGDNPGLVNDCNILLAARDTLAGAGALDWSEDTAVSAWQGITVDGTPERVTAVSLNSAGLTGTIPAELAGLTNLEWLLLRENQLSGDIPEELAGLTNLEWLDLEENQLSGDIPAELGGLTNLVYLWLSGNQLSGAIPEELAGLTNLESLELERNQLSGVIPAELGNLTVLFGLGLGDNQLSGAIPAELGNLTNLEGLDLPNNQLSGVIPAELGNLANLDYLWLSDNQLSGAIPAELGDLTNLESLGLRNNQLSGAIPAALGGLTRLESLYLNDNQLSGAIPAELGNVPGLVTLDLSTNQLTGVIPGELGSLTGLRGLHLNNNQLSGAIPAALGNLTNLRGLNLGENQLSGAIPGELGGMTVLFGLVLSNNQLSGAIPPELGNLTRLFELYLANNSFAADTCIPGALSKVRYNDFEDTGLPFCDRPPHDLAVSVDERRGYLAVEVSWDLPDRTPLDYTLQYRVFAYGPFNLVENITGTSHTLIISIIEPLTYEFRVYGRYDSGLGPPSEALRVDLDNPDYLLSLWEHPDGGRSITHHAPVEVSDIGASMNDQVSSFEVTRGYTAEVFLDSRYSGFRQFAVGPFFVSIDDLKNQDRDLNDAISSYKLYLSPALTLWEHGRYPPLDDGWTIKHDQATQVRGLSGNQNDRVSALYVAAGFRVELHEDAGFEGKKLVYVGPRYVTTKGLNDHDMNDRISSYKLSKLPALTLWEHDGAGLERTEKAPVTSSTMSSYHNDQVSSLYVAAGYIAEVYEHIDFEGKKLVYYGPRFVGYQELLNENMNDKISSYKLRKSPALTLWEHDLEGWTITHDAPVEVRGLSGDKNDRVSSVAVGTGYIAELYEHNGYKGKKLVMVGPSVMRYSELKKRGMSDVISSYKLFKMD